MEQTVCFTKVAKSYRVRNGSSEAIFASGVERFISPMLLFTPNHDVKPRLWTVLTITIVQPSVVVAVAVAVAVFFYTKSSAPTHVLANAQCTVNWTTLFHSVISNMHTATSSHKLKSASIQVVAVHIHNKNMLTASCLTVGSQPRSMAWCCCASTLQTHIRCLFTELHSA